MHNGLQEIQIAGEGAAALRRQPAGRLRTPADKMLGDADVTLLFQFLQMHTQVAVGHGELISELGKRQALNGSQHGDNRQSSALVQDGVQIRQDAFQSVHVARSLKETKSGDRPVQANGAFPALGHQQNDA